METTASLWECAEFTVTSYKLEVGHTPGAPLFMMITRLFTALAPSPEYVGMMANVMSCLASAFCIMFLYWTISHMARRIYTRKGMELTQTNVWTAIGAGVIGALAYAFTDTFWFSAIESEVYALSSMFTALVVWLMLKWEDHADEPHATRWLVLIAYMMGLSIGVHILNLLTIPALVFIFYFRKFQNPTWKGILITTLVAVGMIGIVNGILIPYTVAVGAWLDSICVNLLGLPINTGIIVFALLLFALLGLGIWLSHKAGKVILNTGLLMLTVILIGFSSYASVTIRSVANPPMNSNKPDNPYALLSLLNRDQYGNKPMLFGAYYDTPISDYTYTNKVYVGDSGKYEEIRYANGYVYPSEYIRFFPRIWNRARADAYPEWAAFKTKIVTQNDESGQPQQYRTYDFGNIIRTGSEASDYFVEPTFAENLYFFFNYQFRYMYWRYFMWNFVGRQSDIQATNSVITDGSWLSGITPLDQMYLGPQDNLPSEIATNKGRNKYYFLPFLLGFLGLIFQLNRDPKNFSISMWLFVMMGFALVIYFNISPNEPRERDYIYAGSFYAFCIWIGLGVAAIKDIIVKLTKKDNLTPAIVATVACAVVPTILIAQNWDDHDRSHRTIVPDIGTNYLESTLPNSIIMNYGDNDTFPLWYAQEVLGVRTDVKIMNMSYLAGEWYIDEMKTRSNDATPVPFSMPRSKYTFKNEAVPVLEVIESLKGRQDLKNVIDWIASDDQRSQVQLIDKSWTDYIPTRKFSLPVNKENVLASGIVKPEDADLIVDTIHIDLPENKRQLTRDEVMFLDLLANFDWKRPLFFTQIYSLSRLDRNLLNYLQFDGYAYRLVPIKTPVTANGVGRIDTNYVWPRMMEQFSYGNINHPKAYVDSFVSYNLEAAGARASFGRLAKQLLIEGDTIRAVQALDRGVELLPFSQLRYASGSTLPIIEGYYLAGEMDKGDEISNDYYNVLREYIAYYLRFTGNKEELVAPILNQYIYDYDDLLRLAYAFKRRGLIDEMTKFYNENDLM